MTTLLAYPLKQNCLLLGNLFKKSLFLAQMEMALHGLAGVLTLAGAHLLHALQLADAHGVLGVLGVLGGHHTAITLSVFSLDAAAQAANVGANYGKIY